MADQAIDILREALQSDLLGDYAAYLGTASVGNSTTIWSDPNLVTYTADTRWRGYQAFFPNYSYADRDRVVYSTNLAQGQLQVLQPFAAGPASGTEFWLLRDARWSQLLNYLNQVCRSVWFGRDIYLRGQSNMFRYTLPTPISQGNWIEDVFVDHHPFAFSNQQPPKMNWYRVNPLNIVGDLYLVLDAWGGVGWPLGADYDIIFQCRVPYLQTGSAYTFSRSQLTPFGETTQVSPPRNVLVAGVVYHILKNKMRNLTGEARERWRENLKDAAQAYAEALLPHGPLLVGTTLGYTEQW